MNEADLARLRAAPKSVDWVLWTALQIGVVVFFGIAVVVNVLPGRGPLLREMRPLGPSIDVIFPLLAAVPMVACFIIYVRNVVRGPWPNGRVARIISGRLLEAKSAGDPDRFAADTVLLLDGNFRGASILSWAIAEGGALLAGIYTLLRGFQPGGIAIVVAWVLFMGFSAPTRSRRDRYRERLLRAAGLDDAAAEQLLGLGAK